MIPANALKAVDILFRDITQIPSPFGSKFMFLGVDFRQVLPVVPRAEKKLSSIASRPHTYGITFTTFNWLQA